jgi:hypothetical protein
MELHESDCYFMYLEKMEESTPTIAVGNCPLMQAGNPTVAAFSRKQPGRAIREVLR